MRTFYLSFPLLRRVPLLYSFNFSFIFSIYFLWRSVVICRKECFDCYLVIKKKENFQSTFSHFNNRNRKAWINCSSATDSLDYCVARIFKSLLPSWSLFLWTQAKKKFVRDFVLFLVKKEKKTNKGQMRNPKERQCSVFFILEWRDEKIVQGVTTNCIRTFREQIQ